MWGSGVWSMDSTWVSLIRFPCKGIQITYGSNPGSPQTLDSSARSSSSRSGESPDSATSPSGVTGTSASSSPSLAVSPPGANSSTTTTLSATTSSSTTESATVRATSSSTSCSAASSSSSPLFGGSLSTPNGKAGGSIADDCDAKRRKLNMSLELEDFTMTTPSPTSKFLQERGCGQGGEVEMN
ncbi:unnamed protein product [Amoebophrya sp. A25]|nr:unnamed protein product [Amoebophrya sp. A25]|eukprot:GSA25T00009449001.1